MIIQAPGCGATAHARGKCVCAQIFGAYIIILIRLSSRDLVNSSNKSESVDTMQFEST